MSILNRVVECIALTTRYPRQLLIPEADLENDLGIDSVKRVEIVTALADEFELDLVTKERDPSIRTIEQVANWIEGELNTSSPAFADARHDAPHRPATKERVERRPATESPDEAPRIERSMDVGRSNGRTSRLSAAHANPVPVHQQDAASWRGSVDRESLQGRVALVTGSGRGVGRTIARVLAARGATVVVNSFHSRELGERTAAEINASSGTAVHLWGSVANPEQVDEMFDDIERRFGHLEILVCNASDGRLGSFTEITQGDWDRSFHTNVTGHHHCAMRASQLMQRQGGGSIVTMSSIGAHRYVEGLGGQGVVKAAVESMTRYLACELAQYGIRTNCISGGPIYGEVMSQYPEARATFNYWESIVPDSELCNAMDLANTVAFLVSDEARAINGAVWTVDHGASTRAHSRPLPQLTVNDPPSPAYT